MSERFMKSNLFKRIGEGGIPLLSWLLITFPVWLSPFHPAVVAYFIIFFDLFFLYKSVVTAYHATISYLEIREYDKISFSKKVATIKKSSSINHFIIMPNYKEPLHKLQATIETITKTDFPYKNLHLMLAFENREEEAVEKEKILREKYKPFFKDILSSYHILLPHEAPGKASNQTFASHIVEKYVIDHKMDEKETLITICDADSFLPKNYFSYLTYEFLRDRENLYHFYWAPVLLYNNFWQLPFFVRMQATLSSLLRLALLTQREKLIHISTYSTNLWLLREVGYWDVDIIPEDWHIYYQAFFKFGERVRTLPLFTIINGDAVYSGSMFKTLKNRYEQEKRWAWGASDIGYAWGKIFTTPHIPFWIKFKKIFYLAETHLLWPTSFFILTLSALVPPLVNPFFKRTVLGFILPRLSGFILTLASLMLVLYIYLDIQLRNKFDIKTRVINMPFLIIQWYLLPLVSFLLSSLPALEAHTRLLIGKKITYKVTEKV